MAAEDPARPGKQGKGREEGRGEELAVPWDERPSFYHVRSRLWEKSSPVSGPLVSPLHDFLFPFICTLSDRV